MPGINAGILAAISDLIKHAYSMSFCTVSLCTIPFGVTFIMAAVFCCPNVEDYLTDEVARKLQGVESPPKNVSEGREGAGSSLTRPIRREGALRIACFTGVPSKSSGRRAKQQEKRFSGTFPSQS